MKEMINRYARYCNSGDLDLWLSLWNENGVQMPPNAKTRVGKVRIREGMAPLFQNQLRITINGIQDVLAYHDSGLTRCRYSLVMITPRGEIPLEPNGKALTIFARQFPNKWEIIYDCFNTNVSLP